jgi:tellurium resistance protein TerZ
MNLIKKNGINLAKGSSISLEKKGKPISNVMVGINWGSIKHQLLGITFMNTAVDLDTSVALISNKRVLDHVYYSNLRSRDGSVRHSGDDRFGDQNGDDGADNETITVNLNAMDPNVDQVVFYLNSYEQQDFETIPYAKIRVIDASNPNDMEEMATFNVATDKTFRGYVSMVLGKFVRRNSMWEFTTVGDPIRAKNIKECIREIVADYV